MKILNAIDFGGASGPSCSWSGEYLSLQIADSEKLLWAPRFKQDVDWNKFVVWSARSGDLPQDHIRPVLDRSNGDKTVGFIFSILALHPELFESESYADRWRKLYASVAVTAIAEDGVANEFLDLSFDSLESETALADCFSPKCAVIVIGRDALTDFDNRAPQIRLLLQEFGYLALPRSSSQAAALSVDGGGPIRLGKLNGRASDYCDQLIELIAVAANERSFLAQFLGYYQVIELFLRFEFSSRLKMFVSAKNELGLVSEDPWAVKQEVDELVSTDRRLKYLIESCAPGMGDQLSDLVRHGKDFLRAVGATVPDGESTATVLKSVRNHIVHKQGSESMAADQSLGQILPLVHTLVFEIIRQYSENGSRNTASRTESSHISQEGVDSAIREAYFSRERIS